MKTDPCLGLCIHCWWVMGLQTGVAECIGSYTYPNKSLDGYPTRTFLFTGQLWGCCGYTCPLYGSLDVDSSTLSNAVGISHLLAHGLALLAVDFISDCFAMEGGHWLCDDLGALS